MTGDRAFYAPTFVTDGGGAQFYAKDSGGQWYYVNHADRWHTCPPPFPDDATEKMHAKLKSIAEMPKQGEPSADAPGGKQVWDDDGARPVIDALHRLIDEARELVARFGR